MPSAVVDPCTLEASHHSPACRTLVVAVCRLVSGFEGSDHSLLSVDTGRSPVLVDIDHTLDLVDIDRSLDLVDIDRSFDFVESLDLVDNADDAAPADIVGIGMVGVPGVEGIAEDDPALRSFD